MRLIQHAFFWIIFTKNLYIVYGRLNYPHHRQLKHILTHRKHVSFINLRARFANKLN